MGARTAAAAAVLAATAALVAGAAGADPDPGAAAASSASGARRGDAAMAQLSARRVLRRPRSGDQVVPTGVRRIGALASPTAGIDGRDERVAADVAVVDSGVDPGHRDLHVVGTVNCLESPFDADWHGTHVAGTIAALDNRHGVVGVAPGARIWSVRVFDQNGKTTLDALVCGLRWTVENAAMLDVVNLSASFAGWDDGECGPAPRHPIHAVICAGAAAGLTYVVSAGNGAEDAERSIPAAYEQVLTVSALADYDGRPGGRGSRGDLGWESGRDDHLATYSNFGPDVDLAAPGNAILSTIAENGVRSPFVAGSSTGRWRAYGTSSGTSFAAAHVTGAVALYRARHPAASPAEVREALLAGARPGPIPGDPDGAAEGVLNVAGW